MLWRTALFDLGDTLIDNHPLAPDAADRQVARAFELWLRRRSMRAADEFTPDERVHLASIEGGRLVGAVDAGLAEARASWWSGGREAPAGAAFAKVQAELAAASGLVASRDEIEEVYVKARLARQRPLPGASDLLTALAGAGVRRGVVSNCIFASSLMDAHLRLHGLAPLLDVTVYSSDVGWRKPRPEPFLAAAARLAIVPADAVFVGNDPAVDLGGAIGAGCAALWFWGHNPAFRDLSPGPALGPGTWPELPPAMDDVAETIAELLRVPAAAAAPDGKAPRLLGAARTLAEVGRLLLEGAGGG